MSSSVLRNVIHPKSGSLAIPNGSFDDLRDDEKPSDDMELVLGVLIENAPVCMAMFDHQMRYMLANRQWIEEFGLQGVVPLLGRSQYEVFPGLHPGWRQVYDRALQGHVVRSEHDALAGPDGRRIVYRWEVRPWRRKRDNTVGGLMVTCEKFGNAATLGQIPPEKEEVSEFTDASQNTNKSLDFSACALPMMIVDAEGIVQQANESAINLYLARGIQEGSSLFWEVIAEDTDLAKLRQRTLATFDRLSGPAAPKAQTLEIAGVEGAGADTIPARWVLSPVVSKGDTRRFTAMGLPALPGDKAAPAPVSLQPTSFPHAQAHPVLAPNLPALASAVAAISHPPSQAATENHASSMEIRRLQDDLARARQELRMLREAEKTFTQRDNRMRQYLEALPCGILVLDELGNPVFQNEQLAKLLGRAFQREETVEQWLAAACPNEDHRRDVATVWRDDVWRRQLTRTLTLATADGLLKELEFQPVSITGGGVLISIQDATESCRHEEQLRSSEAKFRTLLHDSPVAIVLMDKVGAVFEVNNLAEELLGHPKPELRRYPLDAWLEPESGAARREALRALVTGSQRSVSIEVQVRQTGGKPVAATLQMAYVLDAEGEPHCTVHFFQKRAVNPVLVAALQPPASLFTSSPVPAAVQQPARSQVAHERTERKVAEPIQLLRTNVNGRIREWSDRAGVLFGLTAEAAMGQPLHSRFRPSDATGFYAEFVRLSTEPETWHDLSYYGAGQQKQTMRVRIQPSGGGGYDFSLHEYAEVEPDNPSATAPRGHDSRLLNPIIDPGYRWPVADLSREKLLLSETHHRIKNHLQIISSLLNLDSNTIADETARLALRSSQNRVRSIAELHQHLYQVALGTTESFVQFAEGLVGRLRECYGVPASQIEVEMDLQTGHIQQEWLMPLALTLNETLSNCFEHAFPGQTTGTVWAKLRFSAAGGELIVYDDGQGLPEGFQPSAATGLGLKILAVFAEQMRGQLLVGRSDYDGTEIILRFPIASPDN